MAAGETGWPKFVTSEFAIAVLIEALQRFRGGGDFLSRDDLIIIGIERGQKRNMRRAKAAFPRMAFRRLRDRRSRKEHDQKSSCNEWGSFHGSPFSACGSMNGALRERAMYSVPDMRSQTARSVKRDTGSRGNKHREGGKVSRETGISGIFFRLRICLKGAREERTPPEQTDAGSNKLCQPRRRQRRLVDFGVPV